MRKYFANRLNTFLDAMYIVPRRLGRMRLRIRPPKPRSEQVYFIGATNVPIEALDPALVRPGRMGRHIWFRTPTKDDRADIFDLYLGQGRPRGRARHARGPRRARAHDQRLLAGDDRAGLLDGAHPRALRDAPALHPSRHRRGDDHDRVGHRGLGHLPRGRLARDGDPRGRARDRQLPLPARPAVDAPVDPHARQLARPLPGHPEGGALRLLAPPVRRQPRAGPRRDGRRARLLRRELQRRRRRHPERDLDGGDDGRRVRHGPRAARSRRAGCPST